MPAKDRMGGRLDPEAHRRLLPLGLIGPDKEAEASVAYALTHPSDAAAFLRRHRVVGLGLRRLRAAASLPAELAALEEFRSGLDALLAEALQDVAEVAESTGVRVAGIKGLSMRTAYSHPTDRDTGDVDLMCSDIDDAWHLVAALRARGYEWCQYEWPWIKRDRDTGRLYGQFQVWQEHGDISKRIDVHFAGYSVRHSRLATVSVGQSGFSTLTLAENLPCLLGNAAGDFLVRLKDVNDTRMLQAAGITSAGRESTRITSVGLHQFWSHLETLADRPVSTVTAPWWAAAYTDRGAAFEVPENRRRVIGTVRDAFNEGARRGGVVGGLKAVGPAFDYYRRDLHVTVSACQHRGNPRLVDTMTNETCVRLIPTARIVDAPRLEGSVDRPHAHLSVPASPIPGSSVFQERKIGPHSFITADDEVFVPTVLYDLCEFACSVSQINP